MDRPTDRTAAVLALLILAGMIALGVTGRHDDRAWKNTVQLLDRWWP